MATIGGGIVSKKVLLRAPLLTRSGYGEQSRYIMRALRSREDLFDIYIQPLQWGQCSWTAEYNEERQWIDHIIEKTIWYLQGENPNPAFDMSIQVTIPNEWEKLAPINIGYTAGIETTKVAHEWIVKANEVIDNIITISTHSKNIYKGTQWEAARQLPSGEQEKFVLSLEKPIEAISYPTKTYETLPEVELDLEYDFNFLVTAQLSPRKNINNTLQWFIEEFKDEEVGLVFKGNIAKNSQMDREHLYNELAKFYRNNAADYKCKLYLLHGDMTDPEMHSLYTHPKISALISLAHGEGFGLPIFEAAYSGLPVVATGWSGQLDFLVDEKGKEHFYNVNFDLQPIQQEVVWEGVLVKDSMWAYARGQSAKEKMRECYEDIVSKKKGSIAINAPKYGKALHKRFAQDKMYAEFVDLILQTPSSDQVAPGQTLGQSFDVESWLDSLDIEEHE